MSTLAEVRLWGTRIGAVSLAGESDVASFQYDPDFARSGIQLAPLVMPLSQRIYQFPELSRTTFYGLPGLLADSIPDKFGNALINTWLATQGRSPGSFNAIERLCYVGTRGMGALEYHPTHGPGTQKPATIQVDQLVQLASDILTDKAQFRTHLPDIEDGLNLSDILQVGTSAGGARAKAVIAWNPATNEVRSGQIDPADGFEHWLLKFDGVENNRDRELSDPKGYGVIEYAYARMAADCGIKMSDCRLFEEHDRRHFMTRRFDRTESGQKLHMQSLCAMAHYDFNLAGAYSYEQAMLTIRKLGLPMHDTEQMFRRMVFNVIARNQDDHVKNIAFLMDKQGQWSLAPAFDLTYSYNPNGEWTSTHQMTINDKRDGLTLEDFKACAKTASMKRGRAEIIVKEIRDTVANWKLYANDVNLPEEQRDRVYQTLRINV